MLKRFRKQIAAVQIWKWILGVALLWFARALYHSLQIDGPPNPFAITFPYLLLLSAPPMVSFGLFGVMVIYSARTSKAIPLFLAWLAISYGLLLVYAHLTEQDPREDLPVYAE